MFSDPELAGLGAAERKHFGHLDRHHAQSATALNYVSQQRVFYGNAESQLNSQETYLQQETVNLSSQQTSLVGVDKAQAATDAEPGGDRRTAQRSRRRRRSCPIRCSIIWPRQAKLDGLAPSVIASIYQGQRTTKARPSRRALIFLLCLEARGNEGWKTLRRPVAMPVSACDCRQ